MTGSLELNYSNQLLLGRLQSDCEYFLGYGMRSESTLWAGNVSDQISKMKELWNILPVKPEWLTMEQIDNYFKEMTSGENTPLQNELENINFVVK